MSHLVVTLKRLEGLNVLQRRGLPHPLYGLPGCHNPDVLHRDDRVKEQLKPLLVVWSGKPTTHISFPPIVVIIGLPGILHHQALGLLEGYF